MIHKTDDDEWVGVGNSRPELLCKVRLLVDSAGLTRSADVFFLLPHETWGEFQGFSVFA